MTMQTSRYNISRAQGEGELNAETLKQLLADVPDHAVIEITNSDTQREDARWWFTARWPVETDWVALAQAARDTEDPTGDPDA